MIIVFAGSLGRFPIGGHAWVNLQYISGLRALGHEVFYLEDCGEGSYVYNWETQEVTTELSYPTLYIRNCLGQIGFQDRWIYRAGEDSVGMASSEFLDICSQADLLIIRAVPFALWRQEYDWPRRRIFIDADPGFTQIKLAKDNKDFVGTVSRCEHLFTVGQRIGADDCPIPTVGRRWLKTVPPVSLAHWSPREDSRATHFTSIMQWRSYEDVDHEGFSYGNKHKEFPRFIDLPRYTRQQFCIALTGGTPDQLVEHGWEVTCGWRTSLTPGSYRSFIRGSRAEFGIAKHGYVETRSGWFSDRSVCYLASGRPVLVQDTGLGDWLPVGSGILTFNNMAEAIKGIDAINSDYESQRALARNMAEEHFATHHVLPKLLDEAMG